ncbi:12300_t:CDS:2, partial [Acaulospora colombiana]
SSVGNVTVNGGENVTTLEKDIITEYEKLTANVDRDVGDGNNAFGGVVNRIGDDNADEIGNNTERRNTNRPIF